MSAIIYEQPPNGLYPTGQRTVTTFPSGLIRVDQTFACKTTAAATHRATLAVGEDFPDDSYPAMDGLKIFPEPQEKRRDDGFTEFTVSGYGRVNDIGITINGQTATPVTIGRVSYIDTATNQSRKYVVNGPVNFLNINNPRILQSIKRLNIKTSAITTLNFVSWSLKESRITNFGDFNEVSIYFESIR